MSLLCPRWNAFTIVCFFSDFVNPNARWQQQNTITLWHSLEKSLTASKWKQHTMELNGERPNEIEWEMERVCTLKEMAYEAIATKNKAKTQTARVCHLNSIVMKGFQFQSWRLETRTGIKVKLSKDSKSRVSVGKTETALFNSVKWLFDVRFHHF